MRYYFQINYCQSKANKIANTLSYFLQKKPNKEKKFQAKNTQILYCLQSFLTRTSFLGLSFLGLSFGFNSKFNPLSLYQGLIYSTYVIAQLSQIWEMFWTELANKKSYKTSIVKIRLRLVKLQKSDIETLKIRTEELKKSLGKYINVSKMLYYQKLLFVSEII